MKNPVGVFFLSALLLPAALNGCEVKPAKKSSQAAQPKVETKGPVVATIFNEPVMLDALEVEISAFNAYVPEENKEQRINTRERKIEYLRNEFTRKRLLIQEAKDRGLDRKEEARRAIEAFRDNYLLSELVREETSSINVAQKDIEDYYNSIKDRLKEPEERRLREIVVPDEAQAKDITIQLLQGADFTALAQQRSTSSTASKGGDLGFIKMGTKSPEFEQVAFQPSLEAGKVSQYFKGPGGYYILKLEEKKEGKVPGLDEVKEDIRNLLLFNRQNEKIEKLIGQLSPKAKIQYYEQVIK